MKYILIGLLVLSGCAQVPQTGVTYNVKYGDAEIAVENYTDNEVIEVEYKNPNGQTLTLKKKGVDNTSPATVLSAAQIQLNAQNVQALIENTKLIRELLAEFKAIKTLGTSQ